MRLIFSIILFSVLCSSYFKYDTSQHLKYISKQRLKFREPSDLSFDSAGNIWIASDDGFMVKTDSAGNVLKRSDKFSYDLETIVYKNHKVYTVDERGNIMYVFDTNFHQIHSYQLSISTPLNRGVEALFYHSGKNCFVCITEKKPVLRELDSVMNTTKIIELPLEGDVSSGMYYNNEVWLLSDENSCIYILNKDTYLLEKTIPLKILNAEGIASDARGIIHIVSDDMNTIYKYQYKP